MTARRAFSILTLACALVLMTGGRAMAQTMESPLPPPTGYVNDYAGVIDTTTKERLETTLTNLDREQQIQFFVVTIDSTNGRDIFDYSLAVARGWGIGSKDTSKPSLLLLAAIKDRRFQDQTSRHLEGDLPDGLTGQIKREKLVPAFRDGQYGKGLSDTINAYITEVAAKRGFSTDTIFAPGVTAPPVRRAPRKTGTCLTPLIIIGIVVFILFVLFRGGRGGRGGYGGGGGWLNYLLLSMLMNSGRSSGSSGWSGGGFGGFGGSGGGGFGGGGFGGAGGGGDFGGGGSGGSW
ncbi:MAG TPA: TPM domain-containing protein [Pyrinomonadaceae bacterium]|nr:TPM domain-containing protein [Pyrinomonadaceae bacterium]